MEPGSEHMEPVFFTAHTAMAFIKDVDGYWDRLSRLNDSIAWRDEANNVVYQTSTLCRELGVSTHVCIDAYSIAYKMRRDLMRKRRRLGIPFVLIAAASILISATRNNYSIKYRDVYEKLVLYTSIDERMIKRVLNKLVTMYGSYHRSIIHEAKQAVVQVLDRLELGPETRRKVLLDALRVIDDKRHLLGGKIASGIAGAALLYALRANGIYMSAKQVVALLGNVSENTIRKVYKLLSTSRS